MKHAPLRGAGPVGGEHGAKHTNPFIIAWPLSQAIKRKGHSDANPWAIGRSVLAKKDGITPSLNAIQPRCAISSFYQAL